MSSRPRTQAPPEGTRAPVPKRTPTPSPPSSNIMMDGYDGLVVPITPGQPYRVPIPLLPNRANYTSPMTIDFYVDEIMFMTPRDKHQLKRGHRALLSRFQAVQARLDAWKRRVVAYRLQRVRGHDDRARCLDHVQGFFDQLGHLAPQYRRWDLAALEDTDRLREIFPPENYADAIFYHNGVLKKARSDAYCLAIYTVVRDLAGYVETLEDYDLFPKALRECSEFTTFRDSVAELWWWLQEAWELNPSRRNSMSSLALAR